MYFRSQLFSPYLSNFSILYKKPQVLHVLFYRGSMTSLFVGRVRSQANEGKKVRLGIRNII
jgi:hypothetical protein